MARKETKAKDIIETFMHGFEMSSYNNQEQGKIMFHVILGQLVKGHRIKHGGKILDPRTSMLWIAETTSGKSACIDYIGEICEQLGLKIIYPDVINDASLIGSQRQITDADGNQQWVEEEGIIGDADIIWFDEGELLLNPKNAFAQNLTTFFQKMLNPIGSRSWRIQKKMAHGEWITAEGYGSLIATTYPPDNFESYLIRKGFLQRLMVSPRIVNDNLRSKNLMRIVDMFDQEAPELDIKDVVEHLKGVKEKFSEPGIFEIEGGKQQIRQLARGYERLALKSSLDIRKIMHSFVARYTVELAKISCQYAALRDSRKINTYDVQDANTVIKGPLESIQYILEDMTKLGTQSIGRDRTMAREIAQIFLNNEKKTMRMTELVTELRKKWGKAPSTISRRLNKLVDLKVIKKKDGKVTILKSM